ncbi:lipoprotein releasing system, transmembrane protein, LolC/E family [Thiobacillus denitrificans ATCC 25259]|uniref:Lipoprotein releasing system, transmembrane protein, LolC/E family n=1 Tax=Thiobacillus denitrificans (strain ATCC 25259 / T1) TaxID=292415 RepID=Q3SI19_THIDA|nr:lipoprotein-releasing ABC transporter permease subunit [Thiobacillus denitrificans]AAZ97714.1 lipoprotein releasing system, transmembrane protein, LolC/E family [Thiobacillus denitrificans ATCC 25259]
MLPLELLVGLRYTHAKRRNHFISFISVVSMGGIALGVMALIVVLSVMNGFQEELRARILGVAAHLEISGPGDRLADWRSVLAQAQRNKDVVSGAPYVNAQGMLANGDMVRGAIIRGIVPGMENAVADFSRHMKAGRLTDLKPGEFGIILGGELARALNVFPGDKLVLLTPQGNITPAGVMPRVKQFTVTGIFEAGMFEYDSGLALIHLQDAQKLLRLGQDVSGVRLKLDELFRAPFVTRELAQTLTGDYYLTDWTQSHANFFRAVAIEKRMMFLILLLIVAVAAFNIVSTLVMAVTDKQSDIAILRTLGARPGSVMAIFIVQGAFIGVLGAAIGVTGGVFLALNLETVVPIIERMAGMDLFPADVYYINELPSKLDWSEVTLIGGVSLLISLLATLYPSWRASRINPAEALRYE